VDYDRNMKTPNKAGSLLYRVENGRNLHNVFEVVMDDRINGEHLKSAVEEAVRLYPPVGYSVVFEDGMTYFTDNDNDIVIPESAAGIVQGSKALNGHMFCVSYKDRKIRSNVSHMITDGGGMGRFASAVVRNYCRFHYGTDTVSARKFSDEILLTDFFDLDYSDVTPVKEEVFEKQGFVLPETIRGKEGIMNTAMCIVRVPEDRFMEFVEANGTSVSVMLFLLLARSVYQNCPEAKDQTLAGRITVNARKQLGIPDTFVNCSLGSQISVTEKEFAEEGFSGLGPRLRTSIKTQTSPEYLRYIAKGIADTGSFPTELRPTFTISYMGAIDLADCNDHVKDVVLYEGECHKLNVYTFGGEFRLVFHFADGSGKYAKGVADILRSEGIDAVCDDMVILPEEEKG